MNYKIVPHPAGNNVMQVHSILETSTKQVITTKPMAYEDAKNLCRNLNLGGGFDAWTPAFFVDNTRWSSV